MLYLLCSCFACKRCQQVQIAQGEQWKTQGPECCFASRHGTCTYGYKQTTINVDNNFMGRGGGGLGSSWQAEHKVVLPGVRNLFQSCVPLGTTPVNCSAPSIASAYPRSVLLIVEMNNAPSDFVKDPRVLRNCWGSSTCSMISRPMTASNWVPACISIIFTPITITIIIITMMIVIIRRRTIETLSSSCWARCVQDKSCLPRAACLVHPYPRPIHRTVLTIT